MAANLEQFVKQLADSGIVAPGKLENFVPPKAHPKSPEELLRELVKQNQLTKFQAQQIFAGKGRSLLLGNYTILDKIGAGGMGQVYKAHHRRMDRLVALKMLPPSVAKDPLTVARFQREVQAAAKLMHPNIVAAHDADEAGGAHFLVMEYIAGSDLSALIKKDGPLPVAKAVDYILQAARGLEFAHRSGVVHRDIKPGNLLLAADGTVKILDMGLARIESGGLAATQAELTGTGAIMGTVDYMAPEQAVNTKHADARADVYSLGVTLWYLLSGGPMYGGETVVEKLLAHREQPIPRLTTLSADVPDALQAVFDRMVAKRVDDRYQTMTEVIADLQSLDVQAAVSSVVKSADGANSNSNLSFLKAEATRYSPTMRGEKASRTQAATAPVRRPWQRPGAKWLALGAGGIAGLVVLVLIGRSFLLPNRAGEKSGGQALQADSSSQTGKSGSATPPPLAKAPFDASAARAHQEAWAKHLGTQVETPNSIGMRMVLLPPGEFLMGSTDEQVAAAINAAEEAKADAGTIARIRDAERPQHRVVITKPFWMGAMEVTIGQYKQFATASGYKTEAEQAADAAKAAPPTVEVGQPPPKPIPTYINPGYAVTDDSPAACITWNDAELYCRWLSDQEKKTYRLPTEAEWEYACRAGTTTQYSFGDDYAELSKYGWHGKNAGGKSHPVGTLLPNPFGLFDMHGNVYEWCYDRYDAKWYEASPAEDPNGPVAGSTRLIRGGYWSHSASYCRSASRHSSSPSPRPNHSGFRCVREW